MFRKAVCYTHPAHTHVSLSPGLGSRCTMLPASGQDCKTLELPCRIAVASFGLATTSGFITFLLDGCSHRPLCPRRHFPAHVFCPHTSMLEQYLPASGLVPGSLSPAWPLLHVGDCLLTCQGWLLGEPKLLPASCVASAALTWHRSPAFLGHLSVTPS